MIKYIDKLMKVNTDDLKMYLVEFIDGNETLIQASNKTMVCTHFNDYDSTTHFYSKQYTSHDIVKISQIDITELLTAYYNFKGVENV